MLVKRAWFALFYYCFLGYLLYKQSIKYSMKNRQKSYGKRYQSVEFKIKINKRKLLYLLLSTYFIAIVAIGILWALGIK